MNGLVHRRYPSESRSVLRDLGSLHREIDSLFDGIFGSRAVEPVADWVPHVETFVRNDVLHVRMDLPGVDPKAVDMSVEGDVLTIRGERKAEHQETAYREVTYGRFERRIRVPDGTDAEKIAAKYVNGVLQVTVPLPKPVSRKININVENGAAGSA